MTQPSEAAPFYGASHMIELKRQVEALAARLARRPLAAVITFGCQMNARDSEKLAGVLSAAGYALTENEAEADFIIFNTCTVREHADNRLLGRLGAAGGFRKERPHLRIAVCGCMMQEASAVDLIISHYPFVNLIFGTFNLHRFAELLVTMFSSDRRVVDIWKDAGEIAEDLPVARKYPFKSGVNIMFGCNNFCSFCIVPYVRGRERSRAAADILREIRALAKDGVREVMLLGQNVNSYRSEDTDFPKLLRMVCGVDGIERVRFMSSHPKDLTDELIEVMASEEKVARHLHLALQSGSDRILSMMNRHYTAGDYLRLTKRLFAAMPDLSLTTDIIVGFPTETEEDVEDTIAVVREAAFDNAFTFIYSRRAGTRADRYAEEETNPAPKELIRERFDRVLRVVQETAGMRARRFLGQTAFVLTEGINEKDASLLTGRMSGNQLVHFPGTPDAVGSFLEVRLTECRGFYYIGERVTREG